MPGYNLPDDVSATSPSAPWQDQPDNASIVESIRQDCLTALRTLKDRLTELDYCRSWWGGRHRLISENFQDELTHLEKDLEEWP